MGWRNLEIDHLVIGELITRRYETGDGQFNEPTPGLSDTETPADTDVSGAPRDDGAVDSVQETVPHSHGAGERTG